MSDILAFEIPEVPYSENWFLSWHGLDWIHAVTAALEIFGVEVLGAAGAAGGAIAALAGSMMAVGEAKLDGAKDAGRRRTRIGFAIGVVTGADGRRWSYVKHLFWENYPEANRYFLEAGIASQQGFDLGLVTGFVQGRKLKQKQREFLWGSIGSKLTAGDRKQFGGDKSERGWIDWYIRAAGIFSNGI